MWKLIKFVLTGSKHEHSYVTIKTVNIDHYDGGTIPYKNTTTYTLQCSCGKIKSKTVTID